MKNKARPRRKMSNRRNTYNRLKMKSVLKTASVVSILLKAADWLIGFFTPRD